MSGTASTEDGGVPMNQLPWQTLPKFIPSSTDMTEYTKKVSPLKRCFVKGRLSRRCRPWIQASSEQVMIRMLGGSRGMSATESRIDTFEKAIYQTSQKPDETHESYIARHEVHFEELRAQNVGLEEFRAYILLRQSRLSPDDRKKVIVESDGKLD